MITLERFNRIRDMLQLRARKVAARYKIQFGGMNSFSDITNLLGPKVSPDLKDLFCRNNYQHAKLRIACLGAMRRYLHLIERYPDYRAIEGSSSEFARAYPDIERAGRKLKVTSPAKYYVLESEKRLNFNC